MKKRIIILQTVLAVILIVSFYFVNNYNLYTKYLDELKNYSYDEEIFTDDNLLIKIETVDYIKYELDKTISESNISIDMLKEKFPEFSVTENLELYKKVELGNQFMDYKLEQKINTIQIDSPTGENKEQLNDEKEKYSKSLNELSSYSDKTLLEKIDLYEQLSELQSNVEIFNQKISDNSEKKEEDIEEENNETNTEQYSLPETNSTNEQTQESNTQPQPDPVICAYSSRSAAVTAGENSGRGFIVRECDNNTWQVELFQIVGGGEECEVLCYEDE